MKKLLIGAVAAVLVSSAASGARAATIDFEFSFSNQGSGSGGGTVTGIVRGLSDNATSAATSLEITSNPGGFGLGEYVGNPSTNYWTVAGGVVTDFDFTTFGSSNTSPDVTCCSLSLGSFSSNGAALVTTVASISYTYGDSNFVFTRLPAADPTAPVPLPAALPLLLVGIGGLGLIARRRRS